MEVSAYFQMSPVLLYLHFEHFSCSVLQLSVFLLHRNQCACTVRHTTALVNVNNLNRGDTFLCGRMW